MLYDKEIAQLETEIAALAEERDQYTQQIDASTDEEIINVLTVRRAEVVDEMDEKQRELEYFRNKQTGSSNGHHPDYEEIDHNRGEQPGTDSKREN